MTITQRCDRFCKQMSFDTLAPFYRLMERLFAGGKMQRSRIAFLDQIPQPGNILLLGEGPGRFLLECIRKFPSARISCVDSSSKMLAQAQAQLLRHRLDASQVEFIEADVLAWEPSPARYDLIVTHFFLDCFRSDQLDAIIPRLAQGAAPNANWLIADFQIAAAGLKRWRSRLILSSLYLFFRATTHLPATSLASTDASLQHAGFTLRQRIETDWGLLKSEWWQRGNG